MGKKKGAKKNAQEEHVDPAAEAPEQPAVGKQPKKKKDADLDDLCAALMAATSKNEGMQKDGPAKLNKKEKEAKKKQLIEQKREEEKRAREVPELLQKLLAQYQQRAMSPYLKEPKMEKEIEEKSGPGFVAAMAGMQGWRSDQEDAHILLPAKDLKGRSVFAVFDGHSGKTVADFAAANFMRLWEEALAKPAPTRESLVDEEVGQDWDDEQRRLYSTFLTLDAQARENDLADGTTAVVVVVDPAQKAVYCANAGDSRAMMVAGGKVVDLSDDHKPTNPIEQKRIEDAGGFVREDRVDGNLAVSRGFGDFMLKTSPELPAYKQKVSPAPEVRKIPLTKDVEYIFVGCDGIWDCLSNEKTAEIVSERLKTESHAKVATSIMDGIVSPRPGMAGSDNMTIVLASFTDEFRASI